MAKQVKSFRISDKTINELEEIARITLLEEPRILEISISKLLKALKSIGYDLNKIKLE